MLLHKLFRSVRQAPAEALVALRSTCFLEPAVPKPIPRLLTDMAICS